MVHMVGCKGGGGVLTYSFGLKIYTRRIFLGQNIAHTYFTSETDTHRSIVLGLHISER